MNAIRLTSKELARSSGGVCIIARPQSSGGIRVMAVFTDGRPVGGDHPAFQATVESSGQVGGACKAVARMLDKCGASSPMTSAARLR